MLCLCVIVQFGSSSYVCSKVRDRGVLKEMCCYSCVMVMWGACDMIVLRKMAGVYLDGCVMFM